MKKRVLFSLMSVTSALMFFSCNNLTKNKIKDLIENDTAFVKQYVPKPSMSMLIGKCQFDAHDSNSKKIYERPTKAGLLRMKFISHKAATRGWFPSPAYDIYDIELTPKGRAISTGIQKGMFGTYTSLAVGEYVLEDVFDIQEITAENRAVAKVKYIFKPNEYKKYATGNIDSVVFGLIDMIKTNDNGWRLKTLRRLERLELMKN